MKPKTMDRQMRLPSSESAVATSEEKPHMPFRKTRKRAWLLALGLAVSALWWAEGYSDPDSSFTPVPAGDVAYGFRSHCGRLQWVQDASWHRAVYFVCWSVPWWSVIAVEIGALIFILRPRQAATLSGTGTLFQK
jgi:hypothetical protein